MNRRARQSTIQGSVAPEAQRPLSPARAFVVHFRETEAAAQRFTGRAEHITSGSVVRFESPAELLAFFARVLSGQGTHSKEE